MGFLGVYKALYDYAPQSEGELTISEGDLLYVLEKSEEDDWWKAKKKATAEEDDEPEGLVPNNYVEEAQPIAQARALYEYTRQTDEELSFDEDAQLQVYDTSDPDWILAGYKQDYGFVPANYIEMAEADADARAEPEPEPAPAAIPMPPPILPSRPALPAQPEPPQSPPLPDRQPSAASEASPVSPPPGPAAALAGVMQAKASSSRGAAPAPINVPPPRQVQFADSDQEPSPALPARPRSQSTASNDPSIKSPPPERTSSRHRYEPEPMSPQKQADPLVPGGFHMYNISEMVSVMGKKKKMPTTLGINLRTGIILIAYEHSSDGPTREWTADKMTHYSREGKHVFLELVRPSKSIDFHAGAKDTAEEIVSALGELAGVVRAGGLREIIMAGTGQSSQKKGKVLYDFMAQGDDEVTVATGDEVAVIDDTKSEEWWQVRRLKNGREGVVPSSYIEVVETIGSPGPMSGINAGMSTVAQNRLDEERLFKEAVKKEKKSSRATDSSNHSVQQRNKHENGRAEGSRSHPSKSKPDMSKVRTWTDRSKSFSVEAQFIGLKDGKINLHKMNGVKIAVPVAKMSIEDIEYVERVTGRSLDEDKPLSEVKRAKSAQSSSSRDAASSRVGASIEPPKSDYDWFQFFLSCEVAVGLCERYAQAFAKDSMDESVLPDVDATVLRNLGLREGDIIKVMRYLDKRFGRDAKRSDDGEGGLFSGPGGTLRNNTRKGRPAPAVQTSDTIDPKAFSQQKDGDSASPSSAAASSKATGKSANGFDDDAWDVKPSKQPETKPAPAPEPQPAPAEPARPPTQAMQDLSLLQTPLEPVKIQTPTPPPAQPQPQAQPTPPLSQPQPTGATPSFFTGIGQSPNGIQPTPTGAQPLNLGLGSRQRPTPPQITGGQGALMPPPPPSRPLSAPLSAQPSGFAPPPLQPQMTGIAPPGQSLNDLNQQRLQQPFMGGFQPQPTGQGMMPFQTGAGMPQQTGFGNANPQFMQPMATGATQMQSPFNDPRPQSFSAIPTQPTGFSGGGFNSGAQFGQQQPTGVNSFLPPPLEPQRTSMAPAQQPQATGFGAPAMAPLQPQQTGPPPPVRFGVTENKIAPQPTGRRANLSQATPQNPFGF